ncbi:MAG: alpha/beta hydrolase fold domain-containing protein [Parasphingorhabdus sp.]
MSEIIQRMHDLLAERCGYPAPEGLAARRAGQRAALDAYPEQECRLPDDRGGKLRALRFNPDGAGRGTVIHWGGGGYRLGCLEYAAPFAEVLAAACDVEVICPYYRLAPEHPFPAGLNDGLAAIAAVLAQGRGRLILSGDSAGGGLAASLAAICTKRNITLAGVMLLSPWLDLTIASPCYAENAASDPIFSREAASEAAEQYLQGHFPSDPLASPLFANIQNFPSTYQCIGSGEVLAADARGFHERLIAAGCCSRLSVIPEMEHVAVMRDWNLTGSTQVIEEVADFVHDRISC